MGSVQEVEQLKPYGEGDKRQEVETMFDHISDVYDGMNRRMTFGLDLHWRARAVDELKRGRRVEKVLDLATGTGDFAIEMAKKMRTAEVTGIDMSEGMLRVARKKIAREGLEKRVELVKGDCMKLPFESGQYDAVTVSFGLRNFAKLEQGLREAHRVLKDDGVLVIVEMVGTYKVLRPFYWLYTRGVIPMMRKLFGGEKKAYAYLPASIDAFPGKNELRSLLKKCGFETMRYERMTMGVCLLVVAEKKSEHET